VHADDEVRAAHAKELLLKGHAGEVGGVDLGGGGACALRSRLAT
jgi:hypothetical protein